MDKLDELLGHEQRTWLIYLSQGPKQHIYTSDLHKPKDIKSLGGWRGAVAGQ